MRPGHRHRAARRTGARLDRVRDGNARSAAREAATPASSPARARAAAARSLAGNSAYTRAYVSTARGRSPAACALRARRSNTSSGEAGDCWMASAYRRAADTWSSSAAAASASASTAASDRKPAGRRARSAASLSRAASNRPSLRSDQPREVRGVVRERCRVQGGGADQRERLGVPRLGHERHALAEPGQQGRQRRAVARRARCEPELREIDSGGGRRREP